jgi:hypothetical protein
MKSKKVCLFRGRIAMICTDNTFNILKTFDEVIEGTLGVLL